MIDITGVDLKAFAKKVYELSKSQGLGVYHFTPGPLEDAEAAQIVDHRANYPQLALSMDYVNGRACKMTVFRKEGRLEIRDQWYDHSECQLDELLKAFGINRTGCRRGCE